MELEHLHVLRICEFEHDIFLLLDLLLQIDISCCSVHESVSQVIGQDDVHDVYLLDYDAVWLEHFGHFVLDLRSQLSFDITNPIDFDFLDKVTDLLFALFLQKLLQTVGTEVVEKFHNIIFRIVGRTSNMEVDSDTERDMHVVFCWNKVDRALESYCIL